MPKSVLYLELDPKLTTKIVEEIGNNKKNLLRLMIMNNASRLSG